MRTNLYLVIMSICMIGLVSCKSGKASKGTEAEDDTMLQEFNEFNDVSASIKSIHFVDSPAQDTLDFENPEPELEEDEYYEED